MERIVTFCGVTIALMVIGIFAYLALESRYAFERKFPYGYRFAMQPETAGAAEPVEFDPNASLLTAHMDGVDGPDDKESIPMPTLEELAGTAVAATGTPLTGDLAKADRKVLTRDDWRSWKGADQPERFLLYAFATPECEADNVRLRWEPDASFDPRLAAHDLRLTLVQAPSGFDVPPISIDLIKQPSGEVVLPTFRARSNGERTEGYVFALEARSRGQGNIAATLGGLLQPEWAPTTQYPRYGVLPLISSTLIIAVLALGIAAGPAILAAIFLSEFASVRTREILKPIVEMISSVPTVVLAYFGLMVLAPGLMATLGKALSMESGRCLLTAAIVMSILVMPVVVTLAEDGLRNLPRSFRDGAAALGMTPSETVCKVIVPAGKSVLSGALLLGLARALGETMIVWILSGGTPTMPNGILKTLSSSTRGIADTIGIEMANVEFEKPTYGHLFLLGLILFSLTVAFNLIGNRLARRPKWQ